MASTIPQSMRSLCIFAYTYPAGYEIHEIPTPKIKLPKDVLLKVYAASINPADLGVAAGHNKNAMDVQFPHKLGWDLSGIVAGIGDAVTKWKVGDEVFGCLLTTAPGSLSEYAVTREDILISKPASLSHYEAASLPLVSLTALQSFDKVRGGLEGKTVLVPGGLSSVGVIACQLAKNVLGATKLITTVSSANVNKVDEVLGKGVVDQVIDYKTSDPLKVIPPGSIDVFFDIVGATLTYLPLVSKTGTIVSCHGLPSGKDVKAVAPNAKWLAVTIVDIMDKIQRWRVERHGPKYESVLQQVNGPDLERIKGWVEEGKIKAVVGKVLKLEDIEAIKEACVLIQSYKGGFGKLVVEIVKS